MNVRPQWIYMYLCWIQLNTELHPLTGHNFPWLFRSCFDGKLIAWSHIDFEFMWQRICRYVNSILWICLTKQLLTQSANLLRNSSAVWHYFYFILWCFVTIRVGWRLVINIKSCRCIFSLFSSRNVCFFVLVFVKTAGTSNIWLWLV